MKHEIVIMKVGGLYLNQEGKPQQKWLYIWKRLIEGELPEVTEGKKCFNCIQTDAVENK